MKGFTKNKKFHPIKPYSAVTRKSRDQTAKTQGVRLQRRGILNGMVRSDSLRIRNLSTQSTPQLMNLLEDPRVSDTDFRFIDAEINRRKLGDLATVKREITMANEQGREPRIPASFISKHKNDARSCWNGITTPEATQNKLIQMTNLPESDYKCGERCFKGWIQLSTEAKRQMTRAMIIADPELRCFRL